MKFQIVKKKKKKSYQPTVPQSVEIVFKNNNEIGYFQTNKNQENSSPVCNPRENENILQARGKSSWLEAQMQEDMKSQVQVKVCLCQNKY